MISTSTDSSCLSRLLPFSVPPIVTFKEDVEANYLPQLAFIPRHGWKRGIDRSDAANNLEPLRQRDNRQCAFVFEYNFVRCDSSYEEITPTFCLAEQIEMSDMQQIKRAGSISNSVHSIRPYWPDRIP
jgi:hypothetical protein